MLEEFHKPKHNDKASLHVSSLVKNIFTYRRTIRHFSEQSPDEQIIKNAIDVARLAPSGANKQPWSFSLIKSPELKKQIRGLAEDEERKFYIEKPNVKWIKDLKHLHPDVEKPFLTTAPYLVVIFFKHFDRCESGETSVNYYAKESAGIATGMLISALHLSGLSVLTYTPKRMQFLTSLLGRPTEERPFMLLGVGLAQDNARVPVITKKALEEILATYH